MTLPFQLRFNDVGWAALGGSRFASGRIDSEREAICAA